MPALKAIKPIKNIVQIFYTVILKIKTIIYYRMTSARRFLHQLRYALVNNYYKDQKLQLTNSQIEDDVAAQTEPRARAEVRI